MLTCIYRLNFFAIKLGDHEQSFQKKISTEAHVHTQVNKNIKIECKNISLLYGGDLSLIKFCICELFG